MQELKNGESIDLTTGIKAKVIKELGRGGQGIVYIVDVCGKQMALKWYTNLPPKADAFYKNLETNIREGAPSEAFLWPEHITIKTKNSFGYVMQLRPQGYFEFGNYLLARTQFKSFEAMVNAAMKICEGFKSLHLRGLSYQDLNDGNFFINPETGDVLICDNDNVMPDQDESGILGKARYMAPEVVSGATKPNKYSDRYSLSVILFLLFYGNHPLEGARVLACPCMTESFEKKFYGAEACFIYDEQNKENRPVRGVHNNVLRRWPALPSVLRDTFKKEFGPECLANPNMRLIEAGWQKVIQQLRDMLVVCPQCGQETFVEDPASPKCMDCGKAFTLPGILKIANRSILLTPKTKVYIDLDNKPDMLVVSVPGDKYPVQLKNVSNSKWTVETQSGNLKAIDPGQSFPVRTGLKVTFQGATKGEII